MIDKLTWGVLTLIHILPAMALVKPDLLTKLYGVQTASVTHTLLHHRAALFVCILVICIWAALRPEVRSLACVAVGISMISFLVIYAAAGMPPSLRIIAIADLAGLPFLLLACYRAFSAGHV